MSKMTQKLPRPDGHHSITPGFTVRDAARVLAFIEKAFGGRVLDRYDGPGGSVMHAEVMIAGSVVMLGEPMPDQQPMPASLSHYVDNGAAVDATYERALEAGATSVTAPADQFYGYRSACVTDMGGNKWTICAVVEQLSRDEILERMKALGQRETLEESGITVRLTGIYRIEHTPARDGARVRIIYGAEPVDDRPPKSAPDDESLGAGWFTLEQAGSLALRGGEVLLGTPAES